MNSEHSIIWTVKNKVWKFKQKLTNKETVKNSDFIPLIKKLIPTNAVSILDVGCGKLWEGNKEKEDILLSISKNKNYNITGIDIFPECIEWRKNSDPNGTYIQMDVRDVKQLNKKYDVIICHHVIEHLTKGEGRKLIQDIESMNPKLIIFGTPIGFRNTEYATELHDNEFELHKCGWVQNDFIQLGYKVFSYKEAFLSHKTMM